jgi:hypothetical protein
MRHGYYNLNDDKENLPEELKDFDNLLVDDLAFREYEIKLDLAGYTIMIICKVSNGKYKDWFIGEEYHGMDHPLLLIPPEDVLKG